MKNVLFLVVVACLWPVWVVAQVYSSRSERVEDDGFRWTEVRNNEGRTGALDRNGKVLLPVQFNSLFYYPPVKGFFTELASNGSKGFYSRTGKCIIPNARGYEDVGLLKDNVLGYYFFVDKDGFEGVCDGMGNEIIAPDRYTKISPLKNNYGDYFVVEVDSKHGVCDLDGRELVAPQYPNVLVREGQAAFYYFADGTRYNVPAQRMPGTNNPFRENRVNNSDFYADYGGFPAPYPKEPILTLSDSPKVANSSAGRREKAVRELNEGKTVRVGDIYSDEEIAVLNELAQAASRSEDKTVTVDLNQDARRIAVEQVRKESIADARSFLGRKDYANAYGRLMALLQNAEWYPQDPEEQCEVSDLLEEVKAGLTSAMLVASSRVDVNSYLELSTACMKIVGEQQKLLIAAIGQGSQRAVLKLQVLNASVGGGGVTVPGGASGGTIDFNRNNEPYLIQVEKTCTLCHGTGKLVSKTYLYGNSTEEVKQCPSCRGTGKIIHLENNPRR